MNQKLWRKAPNNCYGTETHAVGKWDDWARFLHAYHEDIKYTFDTVLYGDSIDSELWYNILYLRALVIKVPDPYDLVRLVRSRLLDKVIANTELIASLNAHVKKLEMRVTDIESRLTSRGLNIVTSKGTSADDSTSLDNSPTLFVSNNFVVSPYVNHTFNFTTGNFEIKP